MKPRFVCFALALFTAAGSLRADLDAYIVRGMKDWGIPGLGLAIVKDGRVVLARGYGVREIGRPEKVDADTIFAVGSTSKAFTAAAIGRLVDAGKLRWDDRVAERWPGFRMSDPWVTKEIRVSDLLANHSGLSAASEMLWYAAPLTREEIIEKLAAVPITEGFRYQFQYRNVMFLAAGQLIPRVAGASWDDFLRREIFRPLEMRRTRPTEAGLEAEANVARPHVTDYAGKPVPLPYRAMDNIAPAGSITSSARDMANWALMWLNGGSFGKNVVLRPGTVDFIQRSQTPMGNGGLSGVPPVELVSYCLGWVTQSYRGTRVVWHNGGIDGMAAWVGLVPDAKLGVVILANLDSADFRVALFYHLVDAYLGKPPVDLAADVLGPYRKNLADRDAAEKTWRKLDAEPAKPALPLDAYAGTYRNAFFGDAKIAVEKGGLVYRRTPLVTVDLRCEKDNEFLGRITDPLDDLRNGKVNVDFVVRDGRVTGLRDGPLELERVR